MDDDEAGRCVDAAADLFGITLDPSWRPTVLASFATLVSAGRLVMEFPLDDEAEPAPVFYA